MTLTKTARLELINPYAKYGLKRRPTFNEIVGLVSENDNLIKPFPNREATRFRNSPQGSFFDGSDNLDLLKEQQTRILDRQMRENIMRRQTQQNGGTFHLMQHQQSSGTSTPSSSTSSGGFETPSEVNEAMFRVGFDEEMRRRLEEERERIYRRQQEVERRHKEGMNKLNQTLTHGMMRRGLTGLQEYEEPPPLEPLRDIPADVREQASRMPREASAEASSSSSGQGQSFSASVKEGAKAGAKQVAKAAAVKGGEILIKKAFGLP